MVLCPVRDSLYYDDNKNPINEYFECPGPEDPPGHNRLVALTPITAYANLPSRLRFAFGIRTWGCNLVANLMIFNIGFVSRQVKLIN